MVTVPSHQVLKPETETICLFFRRYGTLDRWPRSLYCTQRGDATIVESVVCNASWRLRQHAGNQHLTGRNRTRHFGELEPVNARTSPAPIQKKAWRIRPRMLRATCLLCGVMAEIVLGGC